jgi:hypothetical protein
MKCLPVCSEYGCPFTAMVSGAFTPDWRVNATPSEANANTATVPSTIAALRLLSDGRAHKPANSARASIAPSAMKNPGPTARFTHGKQLHSSPRSAS